MRERFIKLVEEGGLPFAHVCARFGISRKTGYKWLNRFRAEGPAGLLERDRAPRTPIVPAPRFWIAEDYHQKYYLRAKEKLVRALFGRELDDAAFRDSTLAARVNGWIARHGTKAVGHPRTITPVSCTYSPRVARQWAAAKPSTMSAIP